MGITCYDISRRSRERSDRRNTMSIDKRFSKEGSAGQTNKSPALTDQRPDESKGTKVEGTRLRNTPFCC